MLIFFTLTYLVLDWNQNFGLTSQLVNTQKFCKILIKLWEFAFSQGGSIYTMESWWILHTTKFPPSEK